MKKQNKLILSISLLASNRKETIRKCLDSLKPLMERVPSELIIVDTGCDAETRQILEEYTTTIVEFEWCRDFSKARNAGLKLAKGEWFLYIDDDEWFENVDEIVTFFKSGLYKKHGYANYIQRNYLDKDGENYSDTWVSRMVRMREGIHFESKIHEYIEPVKGRCAGINSYVHHYGYIYKNKEELLKHYERNKVLLIEMLEDEPDNMRWWVQLAQEYRSVKDYGALLDLGRKGLEKFADRNDFYDNINIGTFYVSIILALEKTERREEALETCKQAFSDKRNTELSRACVSLSAADNCLRLEQYEEADKYIKDYFRYYEYLEREKGKQFAQKMALLVNEAFDDLKIKQAYSIAICSGLKQKSTDNLNKYFKYMEWDKKNVYLYDKIFYIFVEAIAELPYEEIFSKVIDVVARHDALWNQLCLIMKTKEFSKDYNFNNVAKVVEKTTVDREYLNYIKIKNAFLEGNQENIERYIGIFFEISSNIFDLSDEIWKLAEENQISLEKYFMQISFNKFMIQLRDFIAKTSEEDLLKLEKHILNMRTVADKKYEYFDMRVSEAMLLFVKKHDNYTQLREQLQKFAIQTIDFNSYYYKDEMFDQYKELLPVSCQAAILLHHALQEEEADREYANKCLKECAAVYPGMKNTVKQYIRLYGEEQLQKEKKAREAKAELRKLTQQLKSKVREFLQSGLLREAETVLEQLKTVLPNDLEVVSLSLQMKLQMLQAES